MPIQTFGAALALLLWPSALTAGADPVEGPGASELGVSVQDNDALIQRLSRTNLLWYSSLDSNAEVCAVQFVDASRGDYRLRTFPDRETAIRAGHIVTHRHHCGTCSSLRNLAVYLAKPDLTSPARTCARRWTTAGVKACLMEEVGFEERCAETWAYNVLHTRRRCAGACIRHYGMWAVLANNMGDAHNDERGNLNPCLACDEFASGPAFQYTAGRTRRTSGLRSAIVRPTADIYDVDHRRYFE